MINFKGDHDEENIIFPNGMRIKIDFGDKERGDFGHFYSCMGNEHRRVRLFDKEDNLISEIIEENPYYDPLPDPFPDEFFENLDPNVLF
ncbi:hypothetical protein IKE96_01030 [bacterium]|nr:hypothetical protein [bacterium]